MGIFGEADGSFRIGQSGGGNLHHQRLLSQPIRADHCQRRPRSARNQPADVLSQRARSSRRGSRAGCGRLTGRLAESRFVPAPRPDVRHPGATLKPSRFPYSVAVRDSVFWLKTDDASSAIPRFGFVAPKTLEFQFRESYSGNLRDARGDREGATRIHGREGKGIGLVRSKRPSRTGTWTTWWFR